TNVICIVNPVRNTERRRRKCRIPLLQNSSPSPSPELRCAPRSPRSSTTEPTSSAAGSPTCAWPTAPSPGTSMLSTSRWASPRAPPPDVPADLESTLQYRRTPMTAPATALPTGFATEVDGAAALIVGGVHSFPRHPQRGAL